MNEEADLKKKIYGRLGSDSDVCKDPPKKIQQRPDGLHLDL